MTTTSGLIPNVATPGVGMVVNIVRIANEGDTDFSMRYGPLERLVIPAQGETFVTEEVAWHFLGRWWTDNSNPRFRARVKEVERLRCLYGAYEDVVLWERNKPKLAAYTPDGTRITTVIDDPDGLTSNIAQTPMSREQALEQQLDFMQSQLALITARLDRERAEGTANSQPAPATDVPAPPAPAAPSAPTVGPKTADIPNVGKVPVAPPVITESERIVNADGIEEVAPPRLPVHAEIIEMPDEGGDVPTDGPTQPRVGPARVGAR